MKVLIAFLFMIYPILFGGEQNEYKKIYGEPLYITKDIEGVLSYDLSQVDPEIKVIFILPIKVEIKKDTIIIKQGYKKF